ncbi:hypothetical protein [Rubritalea tangerina]
MPDWKKLAHQEVLFRGFCSTPYFSEITDKKVFQKKFYFPVTNKPWIDEINDPLGWLFVMNQLDDSEYRLRIVGSGSTFVDGYESPKSVDLLFFEIKNTFTDDNGLKQHNWRTIDSLEWHGLKRFFV